MGTVASCEEGQYRLDIRRAFKGRQGGVLGTPFIMGSSRDDAQRECACDAFEDLLALTMVSARWWNPAEVADFGRRRGFTGSTIGWDGEAARERVESIARISCDQEVLLVCTCAPLRCHGESVARHADFERKWRAARVDLLACVPCDP